MNQIISALDPKTIFTQGQFWPSGIVVACVCPSVCVPVRTINRDPFKLESPNLDQRYKRPWLRSLLFGVGGWVGWGWGWMGGWGWGCGGVGQLTLTFKVKFNLKSEFTPFWDCPHHNSLPIQARITKFGPMIIINLYWHKCGSSTSWLNSILQCTVSLGLSQLWLYALYSTHYKCMGWNNSTLTQLKLKQNMYNEKKKKKEKRKSTEMRKLEREKCQTIWLSWWRYQWISARLQQLQPISNRVTAAPHRAINAMVTAMITVLQVYFIINQ